MKANVTDDLSPLPAAVGPIAEGLAVPSIIARSGPKAAASILEFFFSRIENENTRLAYGRALRQFFAWLEAQHGIKDHLNQVHPLHIAAYRDALRNIRAKATVKQHLSAIRELFNCLVEKQVLEHNPALSVKSPRQTLTRGKTPVLTDDEFLDLVESIDATDPVGARDRAAIATMAYSFGRVSAAVVNLNREDYFRQGKRWYLRLDEKNGKEGIQPVHHKLDEYLDTYLTIAGLADADKAMPLFRSARGRTRRLTEKRMRRSDVYRMIRRRALQAGIATPVCCHSFRAMGITNYLQHGGKLEVAQKMALHNSSQTTRLYDRRDDLVNVEEVERIRFERQG